MSRYGDDFWQKEYYTSEVGKDEKGQFKVKIIKGVKPCSCHAETCNHFDGKKYFEQQIKVYNK